MSKVTFHRTSNDSWIKSVAIYHPVFGTIATLQNGIGHCCGATFLSGIHYEAWNTTEKVDAIIRELKDAQKDAPLWDEKIREHLMYWRIQGLYIYLSKETEFFDMGIRNNPKAKEVHSFINYASYNDGSKVSLFYLEI